MKRLIFTLMLLLGLAQTAAAATTNPIFERHVNAPIDQVFPKLVKSFTQHGLAVILQTDMESILKHQNEQAEKPELPVPATHVRSIVFCNAASVSRIFKLDPRMLAFCPMTVNVSERNGVTSVRFFRPTSIETETKARPELESLEKRITTSINAALK
jgi:uncharacterized protein (DUF302 family)